MNEQATITAPLDMNAVAAAFIKIREARADLSKDFTAKDDALKASQVRLEAVMLEHLNRSGVESVRTAAGTFFKQEEVKPSCADWSALNEWVKTHDAFDAYERRLKKTFIVQYMEDNDGAMPPGVSVHREFVVRVRRPNS